MINLFGKRNNIYLTIIAVILLILSGCSSSDSIIRQDDITPEQGYLPRDLLEIHYLDVGQADSILVKLPKGENLLIDAGNNEDGNFVVSYLKKEGVAKVDYLIGTHPHEDHAGGLDDVIKAFEIGEVYLPRVNHITKTYEDVLLSIREKNLKITEAKAGVFLNLGADLEAAFVSPHKSDYENLNDFSAVLHLKYKENKFLFTGDAEGQAEGEMLLQSSIQLKSDVLKVSHHGSASSTTRQFLEIVQPKYGIISVGKENNYGHPHQETLERLNNEVVQLFMTSLQGTIVVKSDGQNLNINQEPLDYGLLLNEISQFE